MSEAQEFQVRKVFDPATFSVVEEFVPTGKTVKVEAEGSVVENAAAVAEPVEDAKVEPEAKPVAKTKPKAKAKTKRALGRKKKSS